MARQLWLLRHAEAEPHGARPDPERRLTQRGEQQARAAGAALALLDPGFQAVLFALFTQVYASAEGFLPEEQRVRRILRTLSLERGLVVGGVLFIVGIVLIFKKRRRSKHAAAAATKKACAAAR